jgi:hypothetical protein
VAAEEDHITYIPVQAGVMAAAVVLGRLMVPEEPERKAIMAAMACLELIGGQVAEAVQDKSDLMREQMPEVKVEMAYIVVLPIHQSHMVAEGEDADCPLED